LVAALLPLAGCALFRGVEDLPETYIVFFAYDSAELDDAARDVVEQVADDAGRFDPVSILISGNMGDLPNANVSAEMSERRFAAVEEALVADGVDASLFSRAPLAEEPALPADAIRRIEIRFTLPPQE
jgi:OOP family OmpA-OmpF porin